MDSSVGSSASQSASESASDSKCDAACPSCGALRVGPPLVRPARELPSYGYALAVGAAGALLCLTLVSATVSALFEQETFSVSFWKIISAAETAAWRLKWLALPVALVVSWASLRARLRMRRAPSRFVGHRVARLGLALSLLVAVSILTLIGVTVPERLRQREIARHAADEAQVYSVERVLFQYRTRYGSLPASPDDLLRMSDDDASGSVQSVYALLKAGDYAPVANLASIPRTKTRGRRGALRLTNVASKSSATDDGTRELLSLTNYTLVLPGRDKILNTDDDIYVRDGALVEAAASANRRATLPPASSHGDAATAP